MIGLYSKFGRVVKALALGASLERGMGSNPIVCIVFFFFVCVFVLFFGEVNSPYNPGV